VKIVPANRWGYGEFSAAHLKVWNSAASFGSMAAAVYFASRF
jgi:uncharacterized protein (DUF486 family)